MRNSEALTRDTDYLSKSENKYFWAPFVGLQDLSFKICNHIASDDTSMSSSLDCLLLLSVVNDISNNKDFGMVQQLKCWPDFEVAI